MSTKLKKKKIQGSESKILKVQESLSLIIFKKNDVSLEGMTY